MPTALPDSTPCADGNDCTAPAAVLSTTPFDSTAITTPMAGAPCVAIPSPTAISVAPTPTLSSHSIDSASHKRPSDVFVIGTPLQSVGQAYPVAEDVLLEAFTQTLSHGLVLQQGLHPKSHTEAQPSMSAIAVGSEAKPPPKHEAAEGSSEGLDADHTDPCC